MKTNKIIFIVKGSEDGILGVYTNKKLAWNKSLEYIKGKGKPVDMEGNPYSYIKLCNEAKENNGMLFSINIFGADDDYGNAGIESFRLNE